MLYLVNKSMQNIDSLKHFYDIQNDYIGKKAQKGMKANKMGFLADFYFNVIAHGSDEEKTHPTFLNLQKTIEEHIDIVSITNKGVKYSIKSNAPDLFVNIKKSAKEYKKYQDMPITHGNNTLIMLITKFEEFISDFITYIYEKYPHKYLDNKEITFAEIEDNGIDNVKDFIITREIDHIMRESYEVWFKLFEDHKISLKACCKEYETLKELYARRNIIVHNSGKVNDIYLKNIPNSNFKVGEKLYADEIYIHTAFETIKTIIFCILIEAIKLDKENKKDYIENLFNYSFDELASENYHTAETVFNCIYNCNFSDEITKQMSRVNYWIAKIENDGLQSVKEEIENFDTSALDKSFFMAKLILLKNYSSATTCIEDLCDKGELDNTAIEEWPLFKEYRKTDEYIKFKESHPELFGVLTSETEPNDPLGDLQVTQNVKAELKNT